MKSALTLFALPAFSFAWLAALYSAFAFIALDWDWVLHTGPETRLLFIFFYAIGMAMRVTRS